MEEFSTAVGSGTIAGYRLVRRIGSGSRSSVYLGVAADALGEPRTAALQVFDSDQDGAVIDRTVRALLTVDAGHLSRLIDVATTPDGRVCLVLDRLPGPTLDRVLVEHGTLAAGEAVTIGATVTAALGALHAAGFSHPAIGAGCVRFDASGRPVLVGLGSLDDLPAGGVGAARRRDDVLRLAGFLRRLLDHLDPHDPHAGSTERVLGRYEGAATARPLPPDLTGLEAALFEWAPATAVRGAGTRLGAETAALTSAAQTPNAVVVRRTSRWDSTPTGNGRPAVGPVRAIVAALGAGWVRLRRVRRPVLVGLVLATALGAGGLGVLGVLGTGDVTSGGGGHTDAPADGSPELGPGESVEAPSDENGSETAAAVPTDSLLADDPAAAALTLLALRERCLSTASVLCLDSVDQTGSVASAADVYSVRQGRSGTRTDGDLPQSVVPPFTASVQERTGNSALVLLTPVAGDPGSLVGETRQPASALVIKGEAGWRLRELFDW